jgi:NAD(P)-dependent dehydrogenase (short-subunit alcohol dehydrogenase family)
MPDSGLGNPTAMRDNVAIITGGSRGLGRAMTLGLAHEGYAVVAAGHIATDVAELAAETAVMPLAERVVPILADLHQPTECDRVVAVARERFGTVHILINNAGLTFTYIWPGLYHRPSPRQFWEATDEIVQNVINTNYIAADQMARRVAPHMLSQGWGRMVNVTTKLDTMNRSTSDICGASKAALEMATEIWAKGTGATGLTINIVNPGAGADTPGMAEEIRDASRKGRVAPLLKLEQMLPPLLWLISSEADNVNGYRFDATLWDSRLPPPEAARRTGRPAGLTLHAALNP